MSDVGVWLDRLGLGKYASIFAAQEVDLDTLRRLSEHDLRELGLPLGARRKILQAAASPPDSGVPTSVATASDRGAADGPERRQITVMFADIVGSTSLAERIDIEDLRALLLAYQQACASAIERHGGYVAQYLGDGVMAYFGYPRAHEHDAVSAVHAALTIVDRMRETNTRLVAAHGVGLEVRVGVHTGLVVAGEMGAGGTRERLAVGETPNLAARIQGAAEAGTVLVSEATWRLIDGFFTSEATGASVLKGVSQPTALYRVIAPTGVANPFEARAARVLTPLVGREVELSFLQKRWEQCLDGEGQAVLLQGEPGIGKSRLTRAFRESLGPGEHHVITLNCSSDHQASAFHPVIDQLGRALVLRHRETSDTPHDTLRAYLTGLGLPADRLLPSLAALLDIASDTPPAVPGDPAQRRRETLDALVQFVTALSRQRPVLLTIEDAHWVDPSTEEFLGSLLDAIRSYPVMLLVTARPEYRAPWSGLAHFSTLSLTRLSRRETERMIRGVARTQLSPDVLAQLVSRTEGIPLFIEELTTAVVDVAAHSLSRALTVPATLQEALTARLDRVTPVRDVLQVAALLGRVFDADVVQAATGMTPVDVERALTDLMTAGLTYRRPHHRGQTFEFKHALIQEVALNTLMRERRAFLHGRIAEALPRVQPDTVERQPEILAHHFQEAGALKQAWDLWRRAGDIATQRSATREAVTHFTHATECLKRLPPGTVSPEDEVAAYLALSTVLMQAEGYRSDKLASAVASANQVAHATGSIPLQGRVALQMAPVYYATGRNKEYLKALDEVDRNSLHDDGGLWAVLLATRGIAHYNQGELVDAEGCLKRALGPIAGLPQGACPQIGGGDPQVVTHHYTTLVLPKLGKLEEAALIAVANVLFARTLDDPFSLAWALTSLCRTQFLLGADESVVATAGEVITICEEHGFSARIAIGLGSRGMALAHLGHLDQGIVDCRRAIEIWAANGAVFTTVEFAANLAELLLRAGSIDEATKALDDVDRLVAGTDEAAYLAECQRVRGMVDAATGQFATAERWFNEAIITAHNQSALLFELRATTRLAELLARQDRQAEASRRLSEIYAAFTEGHRAPDLQAAKAALDRLA